MTDEILFCKYDLSGTINNHKSKIAAEIDGISDVNLFATDIDDLINFISEKWSLDLPQLGEPVVSNTRTKIEVGGRGFDYGYSHDHSIEVDAEKYTLGSRLIQIQKQMSAARHNPAI